MTRAGSPADRCARRWARSTFPPHRREARARYRTRYRPGGRIPRRDRRQYRARSCSRHPSSPLALATPRTANSCEVRNWPRSRDASNVSPRLRLPCEVMCTWASIRPGRTKALSRSITLASCTPRDSDVAYPSVMRSIESPRTTMLMRCFGASPGTSSAWPAWIIVHSGASSCSAAVRLCAGEEEKWKQCGRKRGFSYRHGFVPGSIKLVGDARMRRRYLTPTCSTQRRIHTFARYAVTAAPRLKGLYGLCFCYPLREGATFNRHLSSWEKHHSGHCKAIAGKW